MPNDSRPRLDRRNQIETLESRVVMSADPLAGFLGGAITQHGFNESAPQFSITQHVVEETPQAPPLLTHDFDEPAPGQEADFWRDPVQDQSLIDGLREVQQTLASAHESSGLAAARERYGLRGGGQTVAVIDSGIAYDHYALGAGLGSGYRVVGGYDFTEGDADPYDDGPSGSHGTHVAGIVGADGAEQGVAPDVDLVGLRVFDDNGAGFFSWVEQALDWVYDNRNSFENPITTVNLSLGTSYNADTVPSWANLEDEFRALEEAGVFISVSAGNSFTSYNEPGLSYPAASPYVVPVISADDSGLISYFSQRHTRGIVAPGRSIRSTVPDYDGNNNGLADDYGYKSGTSMAAPYVAGASVLIREAMQFVGYTDITQDVIYDHIVATADEVFDSATGLTYNRLNVEAALDALLPDDDFGSSLNDAHNLGTIQSSSEVAAASTSASTTSGLIGRVDDADYFTFTAGETGTVTFTAANQSHYLDATWQGFGGEGWSDASGDSYTLAVVAGEEYTIALSSENGIGYYDLQISAESTFSFVDWGVASGQTTTGGVSFGAETYYRVTAGQNGFLTADLLNASGATGFELYDASLNLVDNGADGRLDVQATAGEEFYLRLEGAGTADIRLTNLVSVDGTTVNVAGTAGDDTLTFAAGDTTHTVFVNGVEYTFEASNYATFDLDGGEGSDSVSLTGTAGDETAWLRVGLASVLAAGYSVSANQFDQVTFDGQEGVDSVVLHGTAGADHFTSNSVGTSLSGSSYHHSAINVEIVTLYAGQGDDTATVNNGVEDATYWGWSYKFRIAAGGQTVLAYDVEDTTVHASQEATTNAIFFGSEGDDTLRGWTHKAEFTSADANHLLFGFDTTVAYNSAGNDQAFFYGDDGDDEFFGWDYKAVFRGAGYLHTTFGFETTTSGAGGNDTARFLGTAGNDTYYGWDYKSLFRGQDYSHLTYSFEQTTATSGDGGVDIARFYGTAAADRYYGLDYKSVMLSQNASHTAYGFDQSYAEGGGGDDQARLYGTEGVDSAAARAWGAYLSSDNHYTQASGFLAVTIQNGSTGDTLLQEAVDYAFDSVGDWTSA